MAAYSTAFKLEAIRRVLSTENPRGINEVSEKIGVCLPTLRQWVARHNEMIMVNSELSQLLPTDAVLATINLSVEDKSKFCRKHGLMPEQLVEWELDMKKQLAMPAIDKNEYDKLKQEKANLQKVLLAKEKELLRKDKALAEAAALLILQKKVRALLEAEDENTLLNSEDN